MKWLSAGLTFVNVTTVCGLLGGFAGHGLSKTVAISSAVAGLAAALLAYWGTYRAPRQEETPEVTSSGSMPESKPARRPFAPPYLHKELRQCRSPLAGKPHLRL